MFVLFYFYRHSFVVTLPLPLILLRLTAARGFKKVRCVWQFSAKGHSLSQLFDGFALRLEPLLSLQREFVIVALLQLTQVILCAQILGRDAPLALLKMPLTLDQLLLDNSLLFFLFRCVLKLFDCVTCERVMASDHLILNVVRVMLSETLLSFLSLLDHCLRLLLLQNKLDICICIRYRLAKASVPRPSNLVFMELLELLLVAHVERLQLLILVLGRCSFT